MSANATDDIGVAGVQFLLDGAPLGAEVTTAPYFIYWNPSAVPAGPHTLAARARDTAGKQTTSAAVNVTKMSVDADRSPGPLRATVFYGTRARTAQLNATTTVPGTFVYAPPPAPYCRRNHTLVTTFTPADTINYTTATAASRSR